MITIITLRNNPAPRTQTDINKQNAVWEAPAMFLTKTFN